MKALVVKIAAFLVILATIFSLSACDGAHVSSYSATMMVRSSTGERCSVRFGSFEGRLVFKLRVPKGQDSDISYEASLEEGEINVYYESTSTAGKTSCSPSKVARVRIRARATFRAARRSTYS